ncbi:MAG: hypothetical protein B7Y07_05925 [Halothiobacillus sp. 24-54-40]|jgi:uncharacterized membrane protein YeaQ/YmgE (transglycosylase-associated protein family)|nr:MAG: hypothetical protein B7Y58_06080 [Halothiobacillus sp. 35-54-62]OYZ87031.1 MAG: hypothetical protein B7Y07_05925 [Halothiobacillus sp. 24-54-40]OZA80381.1 MAG: hypothetical protein B7X64_05920 [Halothiobacillus sp. 39-53-45]HQS03937.1 hypothetical protein [Halothiobacillus sp.]
MGNVLLYLFYWAVAGVIATAVTGVKTGFFWFIMLGLPVTLIAGGLALALVVSVVGAFIGFVTPRR